MRYGGKPQMNRILLVIVLLAVAAFAEPSKHRSTSHRYTRSRSVTSAFQRKNPCPSTGWKSGPCPGYRKDHIVALCAGGSDSVSNMQWQTTAAAKSKDRTECRK
jgi:hypothetical protein